LGQPEDAEHHYQRAIDIDPEYAEAHYNYAILLFRQLERPAEAKPLLEESIRLWTASDNLTNAIHDSKTLVRVCVSVGDWDTVIEQCSRALDLLEQVGEVTSNDKLWFESWSVVADPSDTETGRLYVLGLLNVTAMNPELAIRLFERAWERRDQHESESAERAHTLAAGVALVAHLEMFETHESAHTAGEVHDAIDPEELHQPETVLYEQLANGQTETTPDDLRERAESYDKEEDSFAALEARAFATLLDALQ
jgi:tetratricopeptide (TPR) repeat protein